MDTQTYKLNDLGFVSRGRSRHRPRNEPSLYGGVYPFFQTGDIKAANFYLKEYSQTYNEKGLAQSKLWEPWTLCITIAANIAETAILGIQGCFPDSVVGFIADNKKTDVRYIKYYKAQLKPWPKLFQNLRSSRETELTQKFPLHVVCAWMGNSQAVAAKHYLQVTDDHFKAAAGERQDPMQRSDASVGAESRMEKIEAVNPDGHTG